ncbi:hypothetical protein PHLCEN_2v12990 [Hermanssonia centrifuga]|uniref:Uncharacterized protein n=1 Tax=Hermanssonia centrifuga TaxID=98765 RepID=A0A2R6NFH8_9APHY|nr:hypothetical protein PHLCEN_2v12990 [Hermanssonia centrifuga]
MLCVRIKQVGVRTSVFGLCEGEKEMKASHHPENAALSGVQTTIGPIDAYPAF